MVSYNEGDKKPKQCTGNCICICTNDEPGFWNTFSTDVELCDAIGICKNIEEDMSKIEYQIRISSKIASLGGLLMKTAKELSIEYADNKFTISRK